MQSLYSISPEKIIIGMVGCIIDLIQCQHEGNLTLAKKFIDI